MITITEWKRNYFDRLEAYYVHGEVNFDLSGDKIRIKDKTECDPTDPYADPKVELFINDIKVYADPEFLDEFYLIVDVLKYLKERYVTNGTERIV